MRGNAMHPGRVDAAQRRRAVAEAQVRGGEAQRATELLAMHHMPADRIRPAKQFGRVREIALDQCTADARAGDPFAIVAMDRLDRMRRETVDRAERLQHVDIAGVYSLGAGNRGLIAALKKRQRPISVIAHELTPHTQAALEDGLIDAVLNQDAGHEVRSAIRVLRAKADGLPVNAAQERIRLDIFIKDNLPAGPDEDN